MSSPLLFCRSVIDCPILRHLCVLYGTSLPNALAYDTGEGSFMSKKSIGILALLILIVSFNSCSGWKAEEFILDSETGASTDPDANPPIGGSSVSEKAFLLMAQKCGICHGPQAKLGTIPFDVTSWDSMITQTKIVVPNNLMGSPLYARMIGTTNPMPPTGKLPASEIQIVADWIMAGAPMPGAKNPPIVEVLDPVKTPKTYANVKKFILDGKCIGCHGAVSARKNVRYDTYTLALRTVNNGELVGEIAGNNMPPVDDRDTYPAVTAIELQFIRDWIALGAPEM